MAASVTRLVLLRHGESQWNRENRFTGWTDVDLSEQGAQEARQAGQQLLTEGLRFDVAFTSVLKRAIRTLWIALDVMDQMWIPVEGSWRLNERHYGALQGLNKAEMTAQYGAEQVKLWRRGYAVRPPPVEPDDARHPRFDPRYAHLEPSLLPATESLEDTLVRVLPYWQDAIVPRLLRGEHVLVSAHGNSLRALVKHLDGVSDEDVPELNIPTGIPLLYEFDGRLNVVSRRYLGDAEAVRAASDAVARQAEKGK